MLVKLSIKFYENPFRSARVDVRTDGQCDFISRSAPMGFELS